MKLVKQIGLLFPLLFFTFSALVSQEKYDPTGNWKGVINMNGLVLNVTFKISITEDGKLTSLMDVPQQGAINMPISKVTSFADSLIIEANEIEGVYKGVFKSKYTLQGNWYQSGAVFELDLAKELNSGNTQRSQIPQKPYPYIEQEVKFRNDLAKINLAGTLTIPGKTGKYPAVVLITGSGQQDRDESVFLHKPFLVLADYLTRNGIAVLRFDDRGIGGSEQGTVPPTAEDMEGDVLSAITFLKGQGQIDTTKIGLIGHSEGGVIGPKVANKSKNISFVVLWGAPGINGEQLLYQQGELMNRAAGYPDEFITNNRQTQESVFKVLINEADSIKVVEKLREVFSRGNYRNSNSSERSSINIQIQSLNNTWFKHFLAYDPIPELKKVKCPVLAIAGEKDLQVPATANLGAIEKALKEAGNKNYKVQELKGLNHLLQTCQTGGIDEYAVIEETIAPVALNTIKDWILKTVK